MSWKETLVYVILIIVGILSIYALSDNRKSLQDNSIRMKIRNVIFYMGLLLGTYGLYEIIKKAVQIFFKPNF
jgi:hypothetical protein